MAMSHDQADTIRILDKKICYTNSLSRMTKKFLNKGQKGLSFRPREGVIIDPNVIVIFPLGRCYCVLDLLCVINPL